MSQPPRRNVPASVRQRLLNLSRQTGQPFDWILTRYALERLLYRLVQSPWRDQFVLKGALLFSLWYETPSRLTRDADLLGVTQMDQAQIEAIFRSICAAREVDDGISFAPETVRFTPARDAGHTGGGQVQVEAELAGARIALQIDLGFGDAMSPAPELVTFPTLLDFSAPRILAYSRYTVVAEKFEAMATLGIANSRMKDFFDVWMMAHHFEFDGRTLARTMVSTFSARGTPLPGTKPAALTPAFAADPVKQAQWGAFLRKNRLNADELTMIIALLDDFLWPAARAAGAPASFHEQWPPGGPWSVSPSQETDQT